MEIPGKFRGILVSMIGSACRIRTRDFRVKKKSFLPDYSILPDTFLEHFVQHG